MRETFSATVDTDEWRAWARAWVTGELKRAGRVVTGSMEQRRIRPWATQLVVPSDQGTVWFKANCPALGFEPALHERLSTLLPDDVDVPLAVQAERGWLMTADRGLTLGERHEPTLGDWCAVVSQGARMQRQLVSHRTDMVGSGLPDCAPRTVPERYDWLAGQLAALPSGHPSHLDAEGRAEVAAGAPVVEHAAALLEAGPMPATFQHGDLHPKNVFVADGRLHLFDFGDAQWAHPLEMLAVPYGWVTRLTTLPWAPVLDAYAAHWADVVDRAELEALLPSAMVTHAVNRSFTWLGAIAGAQAQELEEWGDAPLYYLRLALKPFPPQDPMEGP